MTNILIIAATSTPSPPPPPPPPPPTSSSSSSSSSWSSSASRHSVGEGLPVDRSPGHGWQRVWLAPLPALSRSSYPAFSVLSILQTFFWGVRAQAGRQGNRLGIHQLGHNFFCIAMQRQGAELRNFATEHKLTRSDFFHGIGGRLQTFVAASAGKRLHSSAKLTYKGLLHDIREITACNVLPICARLALLEKAALPLFHVQKGKLGILSLCMALTLQGGGCVNGISHVHLIISRHWR